MDMDTNGPLAWTRRDVLRTLGAATGLPALGLRAATKRRVGIIGGGMAGVALAWLLDGERDVVLLEARDSIGGNVQSVDVELDGQSFPVDLGAQYFHPGPYPLYTALLTALGLYPPGGADTGGAHAFPASITLAADTEPALRFVSPVLPQRAWPLFAAWNTPGVVAFATAFAAAKSREQQNAGWGLTLGDWLPTLGLAQSQWEGMLLPWAASLFSGDINQARGFSARAAMIFAAGAVPANPLDPTIYYVLKHGMAQVLHRLIDATTTVGVLTGATVVNVSRTASGQFQILCLDGQSLFVDDLVLASSGPGSLGLLAGLQGTDLQQAALRGIEFHDAHLALHLDPIYAAADSRLWSFLNCQIEGAFCEASMWMAGVLAEPQPATAAKIWKSWVTHRVHQPAMVLREATFRHMLPTPTSLFAQTVLRGLQGRGGVWFAGGYTFPYDSQETALVSALQVAIGLQVSSARVRALA
jgi:predicted NAD/FAD-binding protein